MRTRYLAASLAGALLLASCGSGDSEPDSNTVVFGVMVDRSGGASYYSLETLKGIQLAV